MFQLRIVDEGANTYKQGRSYVLSSHGGTVHKPVFTPDSIYV